MASVTALVRTDIITDGVAKQAGRVYNQYIIDICELDKGTENMQVHGTSRNVSFQTGL